LEATILSLVKVAQVFDIRCPARNLKEMTNFSPKLQLKPANDALLNLRTQTAQHCCKCATKASHRCFNIAAIIYAYQQSSVRICAAGPHAPLPALKAPEGRLSSVTP
jgi:hypothetical protein